MARTVTVPSPFDGGYRFTLSNGSISAVQEMEKGRTDWTVYADTNKDGTWVELAEGHGTLDLVGVKSLLSGLTAEGLVY